MPRPIKPTKLPTADEIAKLVDRGQDNSRNFTNDGKMMPPLLPPRKREGDEKEK